MRIDWDKDEMRAARFYLAILSCGVILQFMSLTAEAKKPAGNEGQAMITVRFVDLDRYVGLWYEIAKIPNRFQKDCARGTTAEYELRDDGKITVVNKCVKDDGRIIEAKGIAKIEDIVSNAKLKVSFVSFFGWRPFWGDYWIIGLDKDYQWVVVGTPDRKYGWVLARSPSLDADVFEKIREIIERNGYDWDVFEMSIR